MEEMTLTFSSNYNTLILSKISLTSSFHYYRIGIMKTYTFKGGIHPSEFKELTQDKSIQYVIPSSKTVCIPITQGGAPNEPLVAVGDSVARGQKIAAGNSPMAVPVHASIAGTVKKIESRIVAGNTEVPCIIIQGDDSDRTEYLSVLDPFQCSMEESLTRLKEAGIVGMGGAGFPTNVKYKIPAGKTAEYVVANASECEPYLTIDARLMEEESSKFVDGLSIAMKITGAPKGIIVLESNKKHLVPILQKAVENNIHGASIAIKLCKTKYPQGSEKTIVKAVLKREIPTKGLPIDVGCVISNVATLCAISEAFREGKPLIDRPLTVSGQGCTEPKNLRVPVGTMVNEITDGTVSPETVKILSGGPMMGASMADTNFPVEKRTSGITFLTAKEAALAEEDPCIGCGTCINHCPCNLSPVLMVRAMKADNYKEAQRYGLMDCIECGACSYVCPSHVRLTQRFRVGKAVVRAELAKQKAASTGGKA